MRMLEFLRRGWPQVTWAGYERDIIDSVDDDDETVVGAANKLGKDFTGGAIVVAFTCTRHPVRVVTTSAKADHLDVLWGEIGWFIQNCRYPISAEHGGPLIVMHQALYKVYGGKRCPISYVKAMVAGQQSIASMGGHHVKPMGDGVPRTLFVSDESSSVPDDYYKVATPWSQRRYIFGNTWPCENFFKRALEGDARNKVPAGDIPRPNGRGYYRRVFRLRAVDSPNVRLGLAQEAAGIEPTDEVLVPCLQYSEYKKNRLLYSPEEQCVKLDAQFWVGADARLFPPEYLLYSEQRWEDVRRLSRRARWAGCDPGEGSSSTTVTGIDEYGIVEVESRKTPDTADVPEMAIDFMRKHSMDPENFAFDRGGGGLQHAQALRRKGYNVRTVGFGESLALDPKRGLTLIEHRKAHREERYAYVNRRAQMYGETSDLMDPSNGGFVIPPSSLGAQYAELRRQMAPVPKLRDGEGRLRMLPKSRKTAKTSNEQTLTELLGCSPDEMDSLVLAVHARLHKVQRQTAGAS